MNLTSELSIFAYKEPKESGAGGGGGGGELEGGVGERRERRFEGEADAERNEDGSCNWKSFGLTILQDSAKMLAKRGLAEQ